MHVKMPITCLKIRLVDDTSSSDSLKLVPPVMDSNGVVMDAEFCSHYRGRVESACHGQDGYL